MSPGAITTLMTIGSGVLLAACLLPQAAPYVPFLTCLSGVLGGGAHIARPKDLANVRDAKGALEAVLRGEQ